MATPTVQPTDLALYGGRDEVRELGARLQNYMPNAQKLTNIEAQAVAQIALAHGLDCFNGEVWGIKGDEKWYGVMVGIKGLRKCARRQAEIDGTVYWLEFSEVIPSSASQDAKSVVYQCILRDSKTIGAYRQQFDGFFGKIPWAEIKEMIGSAPYTVGVGIATPSERSKMEIHARAKKRAEADALKKRFDVSFGEGVLTEGDKEAVAAVEESAIDGEAQYVFDDNSQAPAATPSPAKRTEEQNFEDLFGKDPPAPAQSKPPLMPRPSATAPAPQAPAGQDGETLYRYNSAQITNAVAGAWNEAPGKVAQALHAMFKAETLPENLSIAEAVLIKRPE